ncbi:UTP--glucose-1-phosphate uridylyltransferase GalU [Clostridium tyrobutyricum]|uniref:UTP--glucose-1-phosphate uridylyltransferase GalU n=1 Tax=Clostridium tyrobutyricum TaxID=1519 RepID=UPI0011C86BF3|nr:UTP--glucose-1-phosphate uridylyltransferase GalU [Clostridium tyrobutyricum]
MSIKKAIIPAAGLGTRFLPATKAQPKEMLPIVDKPTIQYIVEEAVASGIEEILIITGRNKRAIEDHFDKSVELENELKNKDKNDLLKIVKDISNIADIYYIRQKEPKGLGHAIGLSKNFIDNSPFAVMLGDDIVDSKIPCLKQLMNCYDKYNSSILGVQPVEKDAVSKYGIISGSKIEDSIYKIDDLIEKPSIKKAPSNIAILGRYIITPEIFNIIENTKPDKSGEIQLTDALRKLSKRQEIHAYTFEGQRFDAGDKLGFLQANIHYALKKDNLRNKLIKYMENILPQNCLK